MKILALVRHAKAEQPEPEQTDFDHQSYLAGKRNAAEMASIVKSNGFTPELLIISSPAKRALKTASLFADEFAIEKKKSWKGLFVRQLRHSRNQRNFFTRKPTTAIRIYFRSQSGAFLAFGHAVAQFQSGSANLGVVIIEFDTDSWDKISPSNSKVLLYKYPSEMYDYPI